MKLEFCGISGCTEITLTHLLLNMGLVGVIVLIALIMVWFEHNLKVN